MRFSSLSYILKEEEKRKRRPGNHRRNDCQRQAFRWRLCKNKAITRIRDNKSEKDNLASWNVKKYRVERNTPKPIITPARGGEKNKTRHNELFHMRISLNG